MPDRTVSMVPQRANPFDCDPLTAGRRAVMRASGLRDVVLATVEGLVGPFDDAKKLITAGSQSKGVLTDDVIDLVLREQLTRLVDHELWLAVLDDGRAWNHLRKAIRAFARAARGERERRQIDPLGIGADKAEKLGLATRRTRMTTRWMAEVHAAARLILPIPHEPKAFEGELAKYLRSKAWRPALRP